MVGVFFLLHSVFQKQGAEEETESIARLRDSAFAIRSSLNALPLITQSMPRRGKDIFRVSFIANRTVARYYSYFLFFFFSSFSSHENSI